MKPRHERTPEIITLSSPEHPARSAPSTSTAHASSSYDNQNDNPISIRLGNNTSTEVKWKSMVCASHHPFKFSLSIIPLIRIILISSCACVLNLKVWLSEEEDDDDDHNNLMAAIRQSSVSVHPSLGNN